MNNNIENYDITKIFNIQYLIYRQISNQVNIHKIEHKIENSIYHQILNQVKFQIPHPKGKY